MIALQELLEHPDNFQSQSIETRGYLYRDTKGVFLSDTPNIPSCCLEKKNLLKLYLKGDFPDLLPLQPTTVTGFLSIPYLEKAKIETPSSSLSSLLFLFLFLPILAYTLKRRC